MKIAAAVVAACIHSASINYDLPEPLLWSILKVEGGEVGTKHRNANGTYDYGPMQVNSSWLPKFSRWYAGAPSMKKYSDRSRQNILRHALINDSCFNISIGSWLLRQGMNEAGDGHFWEGVGYYHSHNTLLKRQYQRLVAKAASRIYGRGVFFGHGASPDIAIVPIVQPEPALFRPAPAVRSGGVRTLADVLSSIGVAQGGSGFHHQQQAGSALHGDLSPNRWSRPPQRGRGESWRFSISREAPLAAYPRQAVRVEELRSVPLKNVAMAACSLLSDKGRNVVWGGRKTSHGRRVGKTTCDSKAFYSPSTEMCISYNIK